MAKSLNQRPSTQNSRPSKALNGTAQNMPQAVPSVKPTAPVAQSFSSTSSSKFDDMRKVAPSAKPAQIPSQTDNAVSDFVSVIREMVEPFSIIDENVLRKNIALASGNGMSTEDRQVSFECAEYLMSNMAYIFMGLVLDESFKKTFLDSISVEMQFDSQSEEAKKKIRAQMTDPKKYKSAGYIVLGVTSFTPAIESNFMDKMAAGFSALNRYSDEFDSAVAKLSNEQKIEYGMIFSNFMYLIRAFTHNDLFMSYVVTVIEKVKNTLRDVNA